MSLPLPTSSPSGCGCQANSLRRFAFVLESINKDWIPSWAASVRESLWLEIVKEHLICTVAADQLCGFFNIVFRLQFADGTGHPDAHDISTARTLRSEALTLRLIKQKTTIPVPEVFAYDDCLRNLLACPFILMEFLSGLPLAQCWYDVNIPPQLLAQRRARTLNDIAASVVQLNRFTSCYGGLLHFNPPISGLVGDLNQRRCCVPTRLTPRSHSSHS